MTSTLVRTVQQIECDFMDTLKRVQGERKLYIQYNHIHSKKVVKLPDSEILRIANQIGLAIQSLTNRSITVRAKDYGSYAWAKVWF